MAINKSALLKWLITHEFPSAVAKYTVESATRDFVVFERTEKTGKVMLPFEVIVEWLEAHDARLIRSNQTPRDMRTVVQKKSEWARQLHSFETHLAAVVRVWAKDGL